MKDEKFLEIAAEQFLGKKEEEIVETILQTLEGHLRAILGTLTVEEVYKDRDQFANLVRDIAKPDVGKMGIEILSFTIKDVYDNVDYLSSLGKSQTAAVKRDAEIGVAQVRLIPSHIFFQQQSIPFVVPNCKSFLNFKLNLIEELITNAIQNLF